MNQGILFGLAAILSMIPATIGSFRRWETRDSMVWTLLLVAFAGPTALVAAQLLAGDWKTSFSMALWVTVSVTLLLFLGVVAASAQGWRLTPLLLPYLVGLAFLALIWQAVPGKPVHETAVPIWLQAHIVISVITFATLTLAAVAALAAFVQERALKKKAPTRLTRLLPSVHDSEILVVRLLTATEVVLGLGLATGIEAQIKATGDLIVFDHKTLFSLAAFLVIGWLLAAHHLTGVRGRRAARFVLAAFLLLFLAYPGVKFVSDVLLG
ncbi:MAG: cytochrome c biogenesis protein CcsA [Magnetospiraceae bacterium]